MARTTKAFLQGKAKLKLSDGGLAHREHRSKKGRKYNPDYPNTLALKLRKKKLIDDEWKQLKKQLSLPNSPTSFLNR